MSAEQLDGGESIPESLSDEEAAVLGSAWADLEREDPEGPTRVIQQQLEAFEPVVMRYVPRLADALERNGLDLRTIEEAAVAWAESGSPPDRHFLSAQFNATREQTVRDALRASGIEVDEVRSVVRGVVTRVWGTDVEPHWLFGFSSTALGDRSEDPDAPRREEP